MPTGIDSPGNTSYPLRAMIAQYSLMSDDNSNKQIMREVLKHLNDLENCTVEDAAQLLFTSKSSLVRFCKDIGFPSFSAFRSAIIKGRAQRVTPPPLPQDALSAEIYSLVGSVMELDRSLSRDACRAAVALLHQAQHIRIHDRIFSTIRLNLQLQLILDGKDVTLSRSVLEKERILQDAGAQTLLFTILPDADDLALARRAKKNGAVVVFLCDPETSSDAADCTIHIPRTSSSLPLCTCNDLIFSYLAQLYANDSSAK